MRTRDRGVVIVTVIGTLGAAASWGAEGVLYGVGGELGEGATVYRIDPGTGAATPVVQIDAQLTLTGGLSWLRGELYATGLTDLSDPSGSPFLGRIDLDTGAVTQVWDQNGDLNVQGLASNESEGVFYGVTLSGTDTLQRISLDGTATPIGPTGAADGRGLAYDDGAGVLYSIDLQDSLFTLDTGTGASTLIGPVNIPPTGFDQSGLAFAEDTRTLFVNDGVGHNLWSIDTATGTPTLVGSNGVGVSITGLAWVVPAPPGAATLGLGAALAFRRRRGAARA